MKIGNKNFENGTHIMGILNLTPDSFYEGSRVNEKNVLARAEMMIENGAEVLDLGAQSTRPNFIPVSSEEEIERVLPALKLLKSKLSAPISIDTDKCEVARIMLENGADMINDIWGLQQVGNMAELIGRYDAAVCIMHNKTNREYKNMFNEIRQFFDCSLQLARYANIDENKIIFDGGIGFAKDKEQNWELLNNYEKIEVQGFPLLLGTSRKSMFGGEVCDRLEQTLESTRLAVRKKVLFVRVHDIAENKKVIDYEMANQ
ncbi:MAG: dihydropteroate synthase [Clostridia bacterium]|nr:dihydropteroate synthase [Clostridia bacterium]